MTAVKICNQFEEMNLVKSSNGSLTDDLRCSKVKTCEWVQWVQTVEYYAMFWSQQKRNKINPGSPGAEDAARIDGQHISQMDLNVSENTQSSHKPTQDSTYCIPKHTTSQHYTR